MVNFNNHILLLVNVYNNLFLSQVVWKVELVYHVMCGLISLLIILVGFILLVRLICDFGCRDFIRIFIK
jgi:hypothetical protein